MPHLVLLGDSIFDNGAYTDGGPDVVSQVRKILSPGWTASLSAIDGATTRDLPEQIDGLPTEATHLVLSVGGNNALIEASVLNLAASSMAQAVGALADVASKFENDYRSAVTACMRPGLPLTICSIYNGCFPDSQYQRIVSTALMVFNDAILRVAIESHLSVIDLRIVCASPEDYANAIEPSSVGGEKIARAVVALVTGSNPNGPAARIVAAWRSLRHGPFTASLRVAASVRSSATLGVLWQCWRREACGYTRALWLVRSLGMRRRPCRCPCTKMTCLDTFARRRSCRIQSML